MPRLAALAISVGVLAVLATWLFVSPLGATNLQVWVAFIAWGCHFHSGGKLNGTRATVTCMAFGTLVGAGAALLAGQLQSLGAYNVPVAVGLGATLIVVASKVPWLEVIPASVYGFAAIFGLIAATKLTPEQAIIPTILSVIIGAAFGFVSEIIADILTKKAAAQPAPAE